MVYSIYIHEKEKDMKTFNCIECGVTQNTRDYTDPDGVVRTNTIDGEDACVECAYNHHWESQP